MLIKNKLRFAGFAVFVAALLAFSSTIRAQGFDRRDVTVMSQGLKMAAWYYVPKGLRADEKRPAIVMAHGFSAPKEALLHNFAGPFAEAGFVVLVFDYRFLGASEGEPRGQIFPSEQQLDYKNAITWASMQKEVDAQRIGVWGSSYSGGHVMSLAAFDRRIKAVVAQVPLVDGLATAQRLNRPDVLPGVIGFLAKDRADRYSSGKVNYMPVVAPAGEPSILPTPESYDFFTKVVATNGPRWENRATIESIERFIEYSPAANIHRISPTPLMIVTAEADLLVPTDLTIEAYERARSPKKLVIFKGGHFDAYVDPVLKTTSGEATAWFKQWLMR